VHMDLGRAGEHCFLLMAGVGWDAAVTSRVNPRLKRATGDIAYMVQAAWMAPGLRTRRSRWTTPEADFEDDLAWMVLGNTRLYGGKVHLTPGAVIDDGQLDVIAFCPHGFRETLRLARKVAVGRRDDPRIVHLRTPELAIETPELAVQLDGDYVGETPMTFSADAGALLVSVPAGPLAPIFAREHIDRRPG